MLPPTYVRTLTAEEQQHLTAGLRSPEAFVLRRCQIVLASARRERAPQIARSLGCSDQCVRNTLQAFNAHGLGALARGSTRPKTSLWTLPLAAKISFEQGLTREAVSGETLRATLARLGVKWKRAKQWITSPDPAYERKKGHGIACFG